MTAEVCIGKQGEGFGLAVVLRVELPGHRGRGDRPQAGRGTPTRYCPYSNATRGNIEVDLVIE